MARLLLSSTPDRTKLLTSHSPLLIGALCTLRQQVESAAQSTAAAMSASALRGESSGIAMPSHHGECGKQQFTSALIHCLTLCPVGLTVAAASVAAGESSHTDNDHASEVKALQHERQQLEHALVMHQQHIQLLQRRVDAATTGEGGSGEHEVRKCNASMLFTRSKSLTQLEKLCLQRQHRSLCCCAISCKI